MPDSSRNALAGEILRRLDHGGELGDLLQSIAALQEHSLGRLLLQTTFGDLADELFAAGQDAASLIDETAEATLLFYPLGWAPTGNTPSDAYRRALETYRQSGDIDATEQILTDGWNAGDYFPSHLRRLLSLGAGDDGLTEASRDRYRLVEIALGHHDANEYAASIPILLAQAEGIVFDVTDGRFGLFSRLGDRDHLADDTTLAGMAVGVTAMQKLIATRVDETASTGRLVRHGIMHGRELGYDTHLNSTKAIVFLIAIIELAQPRARALSDTRRQAQFERWAGSDELDEYGARKDRRGFDHGMRCLRAVSARMIAEHRRAKRYPSESLSELFQGDIGNRLVDHQRTTLIVAPFGESYFAYHETPTGFCLGVAAGDEPTLEYRFAGPTPPTGGIGETDWRGILDELPPDWSV